MKNMKIYLFPFENVKRGSKIIIFGGGEVGTQFTEQILHRKYADIVCFIDNEKSGSIHEIPVYRPDFLTTAEYDYIVVAVASTTASREIKNQLKRMGIDENKIVCLEDDFSGMDSFQFQNWYKQFKYASDGLYTINNFNFAYDDKFKIAYEYSETEKLCPHIDLRWRAYNACWIGNQVKHLEGDYVECGVAHATRSSAIMSYIDFEKLDKKFYLLDSFDVMHEEQLAEEEMYRIDKYGEREHVYEALKLKFSKYKGVEIIKGYVPDTLPMVKSDKICYLSLDMNCSYPEIMALEYFYDKIVPGGIIYMDDYAHPGFENQMRAFDDFAARKDTKILNLSAGQGMIIKR